MSKGTILVVDDEKKIINFVSAYLKRDGFEVAVATDGAQALDLWREQQPSLIVLDLMLPGVDGLDVCREIRKTSDVPIVMLTGQGSESDIVQALERGADDYLTKPFNGDELAKKIESLLFMAKSGKLPSQFSSRG